MTAALTAIKATTTTAGTRRAATGRRVWSWETLGGTDAVLRRILTSARSFLISAFGSNSFFAVES